MAERTMEELLRTPTEGYGEAIVLPEINADHFEIKTNLLQLVQANPFYGRKSENLHAHINSFKRITSTYDHDCANPDRIDKLADQLSTLVEIVSKKVVTPAPVKAVEESCVTCGGAHSWYNCPATDNNQASVCATTGTYNQVNPSPETEGGFQNQPFQVPNNQVQQEISNDFSSYKRNNDQMLRNMQSQINSLKGDLKNEIQNTIKSQQAVMMNQQTTFQNNLQNMICGLFQNQASTSGTLPSNTIPNPKVKRETEETTDKEQTNFQGSTAQIPPSVIPISIPEPDVPKTLPKTTPILESDIPKSLPKPNIPYPSRRDDQKSRDKASNQMEKIFQIFQDLRFDITKIPLNENCSAMLLKKLPEKLGDPDKFLIPCNFPGMDVCHALADLGASINLMPLSIWKRKFHFPTDFVVVDFEVDPRVPLILRRSFLRTSRALLDVYGEEITLRVDNEAVTFNLDQTTRYSSTNDKVGFPKFSGGNPTPTSEPFTSEFILEEIEDYLKDDSISPEIDHADCNPEEDIYLKKKLTEASSCCPGIGNYVRTHVCNASDFVLIKSIYGGCAMGKEALESSKLAMKDPPGANHSANTHRSKKYLIPVLWLNHSIEMPIL
ncbi:hypothetical protein Tco_0339526 [Tanacetum coccineum]